MLSPNSFSCLKKQIPHHHSELGRKSDLYPWLAEEDPRRHQTDEEILYEKIGLSNSALSRKERTRLMKMLIKYRDAIPIGNTSYLYMGLPK